MDRYKQKQLSMINDRVNFYTMLQQNRNLINLLKIKSQLCSTTSAWKTYRNAM